MGFHIEVISLGWGFHIGVSYWGGGSVLGSHIRVPYWGGGGGLYWGPILGWAGDGQGAGVAGTQPGLRELPLTQQESHGDAEEGHAGGLCAEQAAPTDQPSPKDGGRPLTDPPADHGHQWGCKGEEAELGAQRAQIPLLLTPTLRIPISTDQIPLSLLFSW